MQKSKDLISVIVPIYNVEEYLDRCVESIINQTYNNLEIILVDDGSTDSSSEICDKWAKKDNRIKVIHKENGGVSLARNVGLDIASGDYIGFVDSDDYIKNDMYETLYNFIKKHNVDIACCNYSIVFEEENKVIKNTTISNQIYNNDKKYDLLFCNHNYIVVLWNKLINKNVFKNIKFPVGKINEDEYIIHKMLYNIDSIFISNEYKYNYVIRKNSITHSYNINRLNQVYAYEERLKFIKDKALGDELYQKTLNQLLFDIIQQLRLIDKYYFNNDKKKVFNNLISKFQFYYKQFSIKKIRFQNKIKFKLFILSPKLSIKIFNKITQI